MSFAIYARGLPKVKSHPGLQGSFIAWCMHVTTIYGFTGLERI